MKTRKTYVPATSTPTLTQSGLLAVLLKRQRQKLIESAQRRAHHKNGRLVFSGVLTWLFAHGGDAISGRTFRRGVGGTLPRHP
jgi:hypothetical protein